MIETIEGVVRDDEGVLEIPVEGSRYLKQASVDEILEMHKEGWCGGYATDRIAHYEDKDPDIEKFFWFVGKADLGYTVCFDAEKVLEWLKKHRPDAFQAILERGSK